MGAHQAISMLYRLDGNPGLAAIQARLPHIEQSFPEVAGKIQLEELVGAELNSVYSAGIDYRNYRLRIVLLTTPTEETFIAGFVHHSFADGLGGVELMKRLFLPGVTRNVDNEERARRELSEEESRFSGVSALRLALSHLFRPTESDTSRVSKRRAITLLNLPLEQLRELKSELNCSLNELYLYGVATTLRHLYPGRLSSHILVPVNLRPRALQYALGNNLLVYPLRIDLLNLSLEAVLAACAPLRDLSSLAAHRAARDIVVKLPAPFRLRVLQRIAAISTCIATFVPQNSPIRQIGSQTVREQYGFPALLPGHEVGFGLTTYRNQFLVSITTASGQLMRGEEISRLFADSLRALMPWRS